MVKLRRNLLCPCGSGKKYKKCCLNQFTTANDSDANAQQTMVPYRENNTLYDFPGEPLKMSEIILEFAEEFLCDADTAEEKSFIISVACMAWNLALIDDSTELNHELNKAIKKSKLPKPDKIELKAFLLYFIDKKIYEYPDINRFIVHYYLDDSKHQLLLKVASVIYN